ncbi:MAG: Rieske (2Fe-2S) protein [Actinomycetota bacterium]|nr:Rieske (2Fe-2S) protein [Actinomycetota bacterium]
MQPFDSMTLIEDAAPLDRVVAPLRQAVHRVLRGQRVRNLLHGVWLGHPLHPALVLAPVGSLMSVSVLDLVGADDRGARVLIRTGLLTAVPAAAAGLADWSEMHHQQQRVGLVHAASNVTGLGLYAASLAARTRGDRTSGAVLAMLGLGALSLGGYLGGHLTYRQAGGANHAEDVPHRVGAGWHDLCAVDDLEAEGDPTVRMLGDVALLVVRREREIDVLADRCTHLGGPLHEGEVSADATCITCPWHGSTFRLSDGAVMSGPATAPQHAFDVKVENGRVLVRLPGAGSGRRS